VKYGQLYDQVNNELPFQVRMNMILIDAVDVKRQYLAICTDIIAFLHHAVNKYLHLANSDISKEIISIQDYIKNKADTTEKLKDLEITIERIKQKDSKKITHEFQEVKKWISLLYTTPHRISDEDLSHFFVTSQLVANLMTIVDEQEERLMKERDDLEAKLKKAKEEFELSINELYQKIE